MITKSKVRHILIKTNELIDDAEAQKRLLALKQRIADGDDFATLARAHSDDKGSALKGGSLDWVGPDDLVKPFQEAMDKLAINEVSEPIQTQFGWHLIQVLERESKDNTSDFKKTRSGILSVNEKSRKRRSFGYAVYVTNPLWKFIKIVSDLHCSRSPCINNQDG